MISIVSILEEQNRGDFGTGAKMIGRSVKSGAKKAGRALKTGAKLGATLGAGAAGTAGLLKLGKDVVGDDAGTIETLKGGIGKMGAMLKPQRLVQKGLDSAGTPIGR